MTLPDGYRLITIPESRRSDVIELDRWAFPTGMSQETFEALPSALDWDRTAGVVIDQEQPGAVPIDGAVATESPLVGIHSSYEFGHFPVPGAQIPVSGLTWVGVHPQHRRKGILSAMIAKHFQDCINRGETVSALFAAETTIYGRFGYGIAAQDLRLKLRRKAALRPVAGSDELTLRIETCKLDRHGDLIAQVHKLAGQHPTPGLGVNRPGWVTRETPGLREVYFSDPPSLREGREELRIAIVEADGEPRGYAAFRRNSEWSAEGPKGTVTIAEIVALDPAAAHRLWSTVLDLDLSHEIKVDGGLPVDDRIMSLLIDPRAAAPIVSDNVWLRLIDVPGALAKRAYAADLDVVVHVHDDRLPANQGSWRVKARAFSDDATVTRTDNAPDLTLAVVELGTAYLGGVSLAELASAGRVEEHTDGALRSASAAFGWPVAPVCSWGF
jgi:predicted acetyltransferase